MRAENRRPPRGWAQELYDEACRALDTLGLVGVAPDRIPNGLLARCGATLTGRREYAQLVAAVLLRLMRERVELVLDYAAAAEGERRQRLRMLGLALDRRRRKRAREVVAALRAHFPTNAAAARAETSARTTGARRAEGVGTTGLRMGRSERPGFPGKDGTPQGGCAVCADSGKSADHRQSLEPVGEEEE